MSLLSRSVVYNRIPSISQLVSVDDVSDEFPVLINGADVYDLLCPPSSLTGNRNNPLDLLRIALPDKDYRFLNMVLQEVPSVASDPNLTDDDRIATLSYRLASGTPAEDEQFMHSLMKVADVLFPDSSTKTLVSEKIEFKADDVSSPPD